MPKKQNQRFIYTIWRGCQLMSSSITAPPSQVDLDWQALTRKHAICWRKFGIALFQLALHDRTNEKDAFQAAFKELTFEIPISITAFYNVVSETNELDSDIMFHLRSFVRAF